MRDEIETHEKAKRDSFDKKVIENEADKKAKEIERVRKEKAKKELAETRQPKRDDVDVKEIERPAARTWQPKRRRSQYVDDEAVVARRDPRE
jgi:hypothetical protein